jgi:hypothetical protein
MNISNLGGAGREGRKFFNTALEHLLTGAEKQEVASGRRALQMGVYETLSKSGKTLAERRAILEELDETKVFDILSEVESGVSRKPQQMSALDIKKATRVIEQHGLGESFQDRMEWLFTEKGQSFMSGVGDKKGLAATIREVSLPPLSTIPKAVDWNIIPEPEKVLGGKKADVLGFIKEQLLGGVLEDPDAHVHLMGTHRAEFGVAGLEKQTSQVHKLRMSLPKYGVSDLVVPIFEPSKEGFLALSSESLVEGWSEAESIFATPKEVITRPSRDAAQKLTGAKMPYGHFQLDLLSQSMKRIDETIKQRGLLPTHPNYTEKVRDIFHDTMETYKGEVTRMQSNVGSGFDVAGGQGVSSLPSIRNALSKAALQTSQVQFSDVLSDMQLSRTAPDVYEVMASLGVHPYASATQAAKGVGTPFELYPSGAKELNMAHLERSKAIANLTPAASILPRLGEDAVESSYFPGTRVPKFKIGYKDVPWNAMTNPDDLIQYFRSPALADQSALVPPIKPFSNIDSPLFSTSMMQARTTFVNVEKEVRNTLARITIPDGAALATQTGYREGLFDHASSEMIQISAVDPGGRPKAMVGPTVETLIRGGQLDIEGTSYQVRSMTEMDKPFVKATKVTDSQAAKRATFPKGIVETEGIPLKGGELLGFEPSSGRAIYAEDLANRQQMVTGISYQEGMYNIHTSTRNQAVKKGGRVIPPQVKIVTEGTAKGKLEVDLTNPREIDRMMRSTFDDLSIDPGVGKTIDANFDMIMSSERFENPALRTIHMSGSLRSELGGAKFGGADPQNVMSYFSETGRAKAEQQAQQKRELFDKAQVAGTSIEGLTTPSGEEILQQDVGRRMKAAQHLAAMPDEQLLRGLHTGEVHSLLKQYGVTGEVGEVAADTIDASMGRTPARLLEKSNKATTYQKMAALIETVYGDMTPEPKADVYANVFAPYTETWGGNVLTEEGLAQLQKQHTQWGGGKVPSHAAETVQYTPESMQQLAQLDKQLVGARRGQFEGRTDVPVSAQGTTLATGTDAPVRGASAPTLAGGVAPASTPASSGAPVSPVEPTVAPVTAPMQEGAMPSRGATPPDVDVGGITRPHTESEINRMKAFIHQRELINQLDGVASKDVLEKAFDSGAMGERIQRGEIGSLVGFAPKTSAVSMGSGGRGSIEPRFFDIAKIDPDFHPIMRDLTSRTTDYTPAMESIERALTGDIPLGTPQIAPEMRPVGAFRDVFSQTQGKAASVTLPGISDALAEQVQHRIGELSLEDPRAVGVQFHKELFIPSEEAHSSIGKMITGKGLERAKPLRSLYEDYFKTWDYLEAASSEGDKVDRLARSTVDFQHSLAGEYKKAVWGQPKGGASGMMRQQIGGSKYLSLRRPPPEVATLMEAAHGMMEIPSGVYPPGSFAQVPVSDLSQQMSTSLPAIETPVQSPTSAPIVGATASPVTQAPLVDAPAGQPVQAPLVDAPAGQPVQAPRVNPLMATASQAQQVQPLASAPVQAPQVDPLMERLSKAEVPMAEVPEAMRSQVEEFTGGRPMPSRASAMSEANKRFVQNYTESVRREGVGNQSFLSFRSYMDMYSDALHSIETGDLPLEEQLDRRAFLGEQKKAILRGEGILMAKWRQPGIGAETISVGRTYLDFWSPGTYDQHYVRNAEEFIQLSPEGVRATVGSTAEGTAGIRLKSSDIIGTSVLQKMNADFDGDQINMALLTERQAAASAESMMQRSMPRTPGQVALPSYAHTHSLKYGAIKSMISESIEYHASQYDKSIPQSIGSAMGHGGPKTFVPPVSNFFTELKHMLLQSELPTPRKKELWTVLDLAEQLPISSKKFVEHASYNMEYVNRLNQARHQLFSGGEGINQAVDNMLDLFTRSSSGEYIQKLSVAGKVMGIEQQVAADINISSMNQDYVSAFQSYFHNEQNVEQLKIMRRSNAYKHHSPGEIVNAARSHAGVFNDVSHFANKMQNEKGYARTARTVTTAVNESIVEQAARARKNLPTQGITGVAAIASASLLTASVAGLLLGPTYKDGSSGGANLDPDHLFPEELEATQPLLHSGALPSHVSGPLMSKNYEGSIHLPSGSYAPSHFAGRMGALLSSLGPNYGGRIELNDNRMALDAITLSRMRNEVF